MKLILKQVVIQNFMSIGNATIDFSDSGSILVRGIVQNSTASDSNGAGKSSIVESINWCLFDDTIKGISKDDIVNDKIGKDCFVRLTGTMDDKPFEITRYRKHKTEKNRIVFIYNEQDISDSTDTKTNASIERIFGMNFKDFQTNIIFSNDSMKFLELGDTARKEIFDSIVKSDLYEKCIDKTKEKLKALETEFNKLNIEKEKAISILDDGQKRIDSYTKLSDDFETQRVKKLFEIEQKIDSLNNELSAFTLENYEQSKQQLMIEKGQILTERDSLIDNNKTNELLSQITTLKDKISLYKTESYKIQANQIANQKDIDRIQSEITKNDEKIKSTQTSIDKNECPLCKQSIKNDIKHIEVEINTLKMENQNKTLSIATSNKSIVEQQAKLDEIVINAKAAQVEVKILEESLEVQKTTITNLTKSFDSRLDNISNQLMTLNEQNGKIELLKQKLKTENESKQKEFDAKNTYLSLIEQDKDTIRDNQRKLIETENAIYNLNIDKYKYWLNGFKKIKGLLISTITPIMNEKAADYSAILTNSEFTLSFITQKENKDGSFKDVFEVEISRKDGGSNYKALSSGEKRRVDLITIFVLDELKRMNCIHDINVRFYDEIFDGLDNMGSEKAINLLNDIAIDKEIYVISHKDDLKDLFGKSITIIKNNGISSILKENIPIEMKGKQ